ncbi:hypothetical protein K504DRAFT_376730 [Pleomassaria siparia CBS 279.74]|uniref:Zn(2)-C6 fungal-type domain-containing protein n=1 Tax=Pleomassaria siparia CBS 279.74 TaxID=1314801 RepID=A0A6G1KBL8_9PLEO|nr:hypothetical protein K504DRAFT_376730 [Pleomassaria siparia CBS 279.74]
MDDDRSSPTDSQPPPSKRQRTLACRRCRSRKQKCEDNRPCANCVKSVEDCIPTAPAPRPHVETEYVRVLEERIAQLESLDPQQSLDHIRENANLAPALDGSGRAPSRIDAVTASVAIYREPSHRRTSGTTDMSFGNAFAAGQEEEDNDHLILGLVASPSAPRHEHGLSVSDASPIAHFGTSPEQEYTRHSLIESMPTELERVLLEAYRERAQAQYPFLHWGSFLQWHSEWKCCPRGDFKSRSWQGFFVNLVNATSLLLLRRPHVGHSDAQTFYRNGISLLPFVLERPDKILHIQAYLLLAMHALHQSSTERIISLASTTMRYCVQQQLHLSETEPIASDPFICLGIQVRRRCFWCAYKFDRLVMSSFDIPPSIPDAMITVKTFANINDDELLHTATGTPSEFQSSDSPHYTCVSSALHILQCRRIQSEISAITLRWDYEMQFENAPEWRIRILAELENYKSRVQKYSDPCSKGYTSQRWLAMIYHYTLLMLYRPTKESVLGPAGDWSVQASSQACLMFRKTQMDRQIAQPWLGLLVQFQSGITLLYCFWATPPENRTDNYDSLDVPDALRACSNIVAIMADRWPKAEVLRDVFELLAREIPLVDRPTRPPIRLSEKTVTTIQAKLPQVRALIVHRSILRMIEEMISESFPRFRNEGQIPRSSSGTSTCMLPPNVASLADRDVSTASANMMFQLPFSAQQQYNLRGSGVVSQDLNAEGPLEFPGMFDFDSWG